MNWKKILLLRESGFSILKSKNKKHKGEYRVYWSKGSLCFCIEQEHKFFKTEEQVRQYIFDNLTKYLEWID